MQRVLIRVIWSAKAMRYGVRNGDEGRVATENEVSEITIRISIDNYSIG